MEIFDHNELFAEKLPPEEPSRRPRAWLTAAIAAVAVALVLAITAFGLSLAALLSRKETATAGDWSETFARVRKEVVEVYGAGTAGSGVVYEIRGGKTYVLTNRHVVGDGAGAEVRFGMYEDKVNGTVLGYDAYHDIAVVEVGGDYGAVPVTAGLAPLAGTDVLAVGNNLGYGIAAFDGIVSHPGRVLKVPEEGKAVPVYAVTAPVNAGMSGGGLFTRDGRIVGINTYQTTAAGMENRPVDGMSYSVPYTIASLVAERIIAYGGGGQIEGIWATADVAIEDRVSIPALYFAARFTPAGLLVDSVLYGDVPSELGGGTIESSDMITRIGDLSITDTTTMAQVCAECLRYAYAPDGDGKKLTVELLRFGAPMTLTYADKRLGWGA